MHRPKPNWTWDDVHKEQGHCGIVALARVTGIPVSRVEEDIRRKFNKRGNWRGSTYNNERTWFLEEHGITFDVISTSKKVMKRVPPSNQRQQLTTYSAPKELGIPDRVIQPCSVQRFVSGTQLGVTYLVQAGNHVMTVRDGWIGDQCEIDSAWLHWARKKRFRYALEIN